VAAAPQGLPMLRPATAKGPDSEWASALSRSASIRAEKQYLSAARAFERHIGSHNPKANAHLAEVIPARNSASASTTL
jgi:hypothetical protein